VITEDSFLITGRVEDSNEITLLTINDMVISLDEGAEFSAEKELYSYKFSYRITSLKKGTNIFSIAAWDNAGNIGAFNLKIFYRSGV
jgi:hypothetical protein